jgi:polyketide biosynthesis enoyl-CoA hydratase PksH
MTSTTLHRVQVPPTLDAGSTSELADSIERAISEPRGVVVLAGGEGKFCRGIDFTSLLAAEETGTLPAECARSVDAFVQCVWLIRSCAKPVIAAVDGETLAGGVGLAAACDLVVATERSTFGLPEALFGLVPAITLPVLLERMTPQKARLVMMSAASYGAAEAQTLGLVDVVTSAEALAATVRARARMLARTSPEAVGALKRQRGSLALAEGRAVLERGGETTRALLQSQHVGQAIREFMAGGPLPWEAR